MHYLDSRKAKFDIKTLSFNEALSAGSVSPSLAELRSNPVILVGNSDWAAQLLSPLRFHVVQDDSTDMFWIADRQNPSKRDWSGKIDQPYESYTRDYAIISRFFDPTTGQTIIAVVGLGLHATSAAAEFITNPSFMSQVAPGNSPDWQKKNLQIVISTTIAGESWGSPQLLAKYFW